MDDVSDLRDAVVAASLAAAGTIHLAAAYSHRSSLGTAALFVAIGVAQVVSARPRSRWRNGRRRLLLAGGTLATLLAWLVSRTVGVGLLHHGTVEAIGILDGAAVVLEIIAVAGLVVRRGAGEARSRSPRGRWLPSVPVAAGLVVAATLVCVAPPGGHPDGHEHPEIARRPSPAPAPATVRSEPASAPLADARPPCHGGSPVCTAHSHP